MRTSTPITKLQRTASGIVLTTAAGATETFDAVVLATHSDISLQILGDGATEEEKAVLSAIPYNSNDVYLHTDQALMPVDKRAWASWNFLVSIVMLSAWFACILCHFVFTCTAFRHVGYSLNTFACWW